MSIVGTVHEDITTDVLGNIGSWQWMVVFVTTAFMMTTIFNQYEDIFLLAPPRNVECDLPRTSTILNSTLCTYTIINSTNENKCSRWHVKLLWVIWISKTRLLFCDHKVKILATTVICRLGLTFGFVILGLLCDSFGRKKTVIISIVAELLFRLILIFSDSESWFNLLIFLRSLFASANFYVGLILTIICTVCEIASCTWRTTLMMIVSSPRLLATVCLVPIVNLSPNQETFNTFACSFDILLLLTLRWTPESPQWLLYNRKIPQAEKVLLRAVKVNDINVCSDFKIRPVNHSAYDCLDESWTCIGILTVPNVRILTAAIILFWGIYYFLCSSLYIRIHSKQEKYLIFQLLFIIIILEFINWCLVKKLKLRTFLVLNILFIGVCSISLLFMERFKTNHILSSIISSLALGSGMIGHGLILNITPRLFAINIRATLFGCCNSAGQLGSIVCYLLITLNKIDDFTCKIIEASLAIVLTVLCYVIPHVDGRELPDVVGDMDYFTELSKPLRWVAQKTNSASQEELEMRVYSFSSDVQNLSITQCGRRHHARMRPTQLGTLIQRITNNLLDFIHKYMPLVQKAK